MTSGQEIEQVYSYNPGARMGLSVTLSHSRIASKWLMVITLFLG